MAAAGGARRRSRYDTPRWAEKFPETPEGFDAMHNHGEARKLPRHTDPDSIDDPDVRDAFLQQMQEEADAGDGKAARKRRLRVVNGDGQTATPAPAGTPLRSRMFAASGGLDDSLGSAVLGVVGYALLVNYVRGGWPGVRLGLSAKFTNGGGTLP